MVDTNAEEPTTSVEEKVKDAVNDDDSDNDEIDNLIAHLGSGAPLPELKKTVPSLVTYSPEEAEVVAKFEANYYTKKIHASDNCLHEVVSPMGVDAELFERKTEPATTYDFELDEFQKRAINCIDNNQSVLVSAHTSAGKTVVALYAIALALKNRQRVIYTSPIKALSNQKYRELEEKFTDVGLMTGDVTLNPDASCIVMTTEILRSMLYRGSPLMHEIGWVIFDEVHYMRDKERGVVWEETIIMLPDTVHYVFLSATIPNAKQFASWICSLHKQPCHVVYTDYRPTPLQHFIFPVNGDGLYEAVGVNGKFNEAAFEKAMQHLSKDDSADMTNRKSKVSAQQLENVNKIIKTIGEKDFLPCIVFSFSRRECEDYASKLNDIDYLDFKKKKAVEKVFDMATNVLTEDDKNLSQCKMIYPFLKRGIGVHHSGLLPILKEVVELLFGEGLIKVLFATETFAMGLNMPARTVLFTSARKFDGKDNRWISSGEYIQMSGRAGRRGKDDKGIVILMVEQAMSKEVAKNLIKGKADALNSQFRLTYNMILNLLRVEGVEPDFILKKSFFHFQNQESLPAMATRIADKKDEIAKFVVPKETDIFGYYELERNIKNIEKSIRATVMSPKYAKSYLIAGRVVRIIRNDTDLGYCAVYASNRTDNPDITKTEAIHTVKIIVRLDPTTTSKGGLDALRPPQKNGPSVSELIEVPYDDIAELTRIKLIIPKKVETPEARKSVSLKVEETMNKLKMQNQNIYLDPIEAMNIKEEAFISDYDNLKKMKQRFATHELRNDPEFDKIYKLYQQKMELQSELRNLQLDFKRAQSESLMAELEGRKRVLRRLEYCSEGDIITNKGRVACEISAADELLLTEMIFANVFKELDAATSAALLSCFVSQEKSNNPRLAESLGGALRTMQNYARRIAQATIDARLEMDQEEYVESFRPQMMDIVYNWIQGQSFQEICDSNKDVFEGSIIRCLRRLEELLREMVGAARSIGNEAMIATFEEAREKLKRDIVFAASLYI